MKHGGPASDQGDRNQNGGKRRRVSEKYQTEPGEQHAAGESGRHRVTVTYRPDKGLKKRRGDLHGERDETHLSERQRVRFLQDRERCRNHRLKQIIQEMRRADREENSHRGRLIF